MDLSFLFQLARSISVLSWPPGNTTLSHALIESSFHNKPPCFLYYMKSLNYIVCPVLITFQPLSER